MLLGLSAAPSYGGYDPLVDAPLSNEFANAACRAGHTLLSPQIRLVDPAGNPVGAIAEDAVGDGLVGPLLKAILVDPFRRSRDGDRLFYLNDQDLLALLPNIGDTRLADVIVRNSAIDAMQANAFVAVP